MFQSPMLRSQSSMRLPYCAGVHSTFAFASSIGWRTSVDRDEPVVGDAEDQRRVAAPAVRVAVVDGARLDEQPALLQVADDLARRASSVELAVQPAVLGVEAARLVDGRQHRQVVDARTSSKSSAPQPGAMWTMPGAGRPSTPRPTGSRGARRRARAELVERARVAPADELRAGQASRERAPPASARLRPSRRSRSRPYSASGLTAAATFAGSVHGVVVQIDERLAAAGRVSGKRTHSDGSVAVLVDARRRARAGRARCRSAGTTRSSGGRGRASRARGRPSGSARCTRCSCR